jgi:hypothetical protein
LQVLSGGKAAGELVEGYEKEAVEKVKELKGHVMASLQLESVDLAFTNYQLISTVKNDVQDLKGSGDIENLKGSIDELKKSLKGSIDELKKSIEASSGDLERTSDASADGEPSTGWMPPSWTPATETSASETTADASTAVEPTTTDSSTDATTDVTVSTAESSAAKEPAPEEKADELTVGSHARALGSEELTDSQSNLETPVEEALERLERAMATRGAEE